MKTNFSVFSFVSMRLVSHWRTHCLGLPWWTSGSTLGQGTKISCAMGQLRQHATTREPPSCSEQPAGGNERIPRAVARTRCSQINKHINIKKKKLLPKPRLQRFTPMFSAKGFTVLAFIPRSVINFELIFVYDVRKGSTFMHVDIQLSQHHWLKGCWIFQRCG